MRTARGIPGERRVMTMGSYLPHTEEERGEMLEAIGVHTIEELYR